MVWENNLVPEGVEGIPVLDGREIPKMRERWKQGVDERMEEKGEEPKEKAKRKLCEALSVRSGGWEGVGERGKREYCSKWKWRRE